VTELDPGQGSYKQAPVQFVCAGGVVRNPDWREQKITTGRVIVTLCVDARVRVIGGEGQRRVLLPLGRHVTIALLTDRAASIC
jgi:hypothetical protein